MKHRITSLVSLIGIFFIATLASANSVDEIRERGVVKIGVANFAPWTFPNLKGDYEGFDIDVGYQIAADLGVEVEFVLLELDKVPVALESGEIDIMAAGLAITPSRALEVDFSNPYFSTGITLVVQNDIESQIESLGSLDGAGVKIAVVEGTFSSSVARAYIEPSNLKTYKTPAEANQALLKREVHGLFTNLPEAGVLIARHPDTLMAPFSRSVINSVAGLAVKRGNQDLLNFLNAWIASRKADTWLEKSYSYWFESFDWLSHSSEE